MVKQSSATGRADTDNRQFERSLGRHNETDQELAVQFQ